MEKIKKHFYTEEEIQFLKENIKGVLIRDLTLMFNEKFNSNLTYSQIRSCTHNKKLTNGLQTTFRLGLTPWNKGTKGICKPNKTSFKKGLVPHNHVSVGSTTIDSDGYHKVKTKEPNIWAFIHRQIYEDHHGKLSEGMKVIFLDTDRNNLDIDNLVAIHSSEMLILNQKGMIYTDSTLTKTGVLIAKTLRKTYQVERGLNS